MMQQGLDWLRSYEKYFKLKKIITKEKQTNKKLETYRETDDSWVIDDFKK